jgi:hypothetical protein
VEAGGEEHTYESAEAFGRDWVAVKRPFVPSEDLPVADYGPETYAILVLDPPATGAPAVVYADGETQPVESLLTGQYRPATAERTAAGEQPVDEPASTDESPAVETEDDAIALFAQRHLIERSDAVTPVDEVYRAFEDWATAREFPVTSREWFSRRLGDHVSFERDREWIDGDSVRCYTGLELSDPLGSPGDDD